MKIALTLKPPFCSEHRIPMKWGETDFTYAENGVDVVVRHVPAWICEHGDDVAFAPGVTDELIATIRQLIRIAQQAKLNYPSLPQ